MVAGQAVGSGSRLARLDDTGIRDAYESAKSLKRSTDQAADLAGRNVERSKALEGAGAISARDLEQATWSFTNAQGMQADAEARLASAERQLRKTDLRAPFSGVVSERRVNVGDDVTPGTALFTVVDLGSLRLDASVPSEQLGLLKVGSPVEFSVDGLCDNSVRARRFTEFSTDTRGFKIRQAVTIDGAIDACAAQNPTAGKPACLATRSLWNINAEHHRVLQSLRAQGFQVIDTVYKDFVIYDVWSKAPLRTWEQPACATAQRSCAT